MRIFSRNRLAALTVTVAMAALAAAGPAGAVGGSCRFEGGTSSQRAAVRAALAASAFDWSLLPGTIVVHIGNVGCSFARPGEVWLDAGLLDAGRFAWAVVQHEFAHQVDFLLLTEPARARLAVQLGASTWWPSAGTLHGACGAERFASTFVWAYWPSPYNTFRPRCRGDESGAMAPVPFRRALGELLGSGARAARSGP